MEHANKPKILLNGTALTDQATGLGVYGHELISRLIPLGAERFDLRLYTSSAPLLEEFGNRAYPVSPSLSPARGFSGHLKRLAWCQTSLPRLARGFDLVYSPVPEGVAWKQAPQVVTVHDLIPALFPQYSPKMAHYFKRGLPWVLKHSLAAVCVSRSTARDLERSGAQVPFEVIHEGCDHRRYRPEPRRPLPAHYGLERYFFYVGDFRRYKNLHKSLEGFAQADLEGVVFALAGKKDGVFYPELLETVKRLGIEEKVRFLGYVPDEDLPALYQNALALSFASLYEGFGLPPLEAMASGTPVILSELSSLPEVSGEAGYYVDAHSTDSLAAAYRALALDKALREKHRQLGLERAQDFTWERSAQAHLDLFERLLAR